MIDGGVWKLLSITLSPLKDTTFYMMDNPINLWDYIFFIKIISAFLQNFALNTDNVSKGNETT